MSENLLIMGASGFLGSYLSAYFRNLNLNVISHGYNNKQDLVFDATDYTKVEKALIKWSPKVLINCIAFTDVNQCENQPEKAYLLNSKVVSNISKCIEKNGLDTYLVHISTDHLYDGIAPSDEDQIVLKNYYAYSKLIGDLYAMSHNSLVLRTNFFGFNPYYPNKGLTEWIFNNLDSGNLINAFDDIFFNPLSIHSLANYIRQLIDVKPNGIYNLGSKSGISKAEFIVGFADYVGLSKDLINIVSSENSNAFSVKRPKNMIMNCTKLEKLLGINMPTISEELEKSSTYYIEFKERV